MHSVAHRYPLVAPLTGCRRASPWSGGGELSSRRFQHHPSTRHSPVVAPGVAQPTPRSGASARCAGYGRYVTTTPRVAVVGAGFGGLAAAAAVRETAGVVVDERGDQVGGVWRE